VVVGIALATIALALLLGYLPSERPLSDAEVGALAARTGRTLAEVRGERLSREVYLAGRLGSWAMLGVGLLLAGLGALYRAEVETRCQACGRQVFAVRASFGLRCPACHGYARVNWILVASTALFWLLAASVAVVLIVLVAA